MKRRILFIDDFAPSLKLYERIATQLEGCEAATFESSTQALAWAEFNDPELVVCDQNMPSPTGLEFVERFRALRGRADTPIVMISASLDPVLRRKSAAAGVVACMLKPVDPLEFLHLARTFIASRRARMEASARVDALLEQTRTLTAALELKDAETCALLARTVERRDPTTFQHMCRVAELCSQIAVAAGLSFNEVTLLRAAAQAHDIGKSAVSERILAKASALSSQERTLVQEHARAGHDMLAASESPLLQAAAQIALTHHENYDGSGYPGGLRGEAIPLFGRIAAVADTYAALIADRPYRRALAPGLAMQTVERAAGSRFDPRIVRAFREAVLQPREPRTANANANPLLLR